LLYRLSKRTMPQFFTAQSITQMTHQHTSLVTGFRVEQLTSLLPGQLTRA
jgi:hypothetical protein